jgi:protein gp37
MTTIEWTEITDNIIVAIIGGWWCRMISEGCVNCYAARLNQSDYFGGNRLAYTGQPPELKLRTEIIDGWARMTKPKKHFVASMTDIFGDWVPSDWIFRFLDGMVAAPKQTFQLLTKRAEIMQAAVVAYCRARGIKALPPNIWGGVSVENQRRGDERIPFLLNTPFAVRFLSVEPLLSEFNLMRPLLDFKFKFCDGASIHELKDRVNSMPWIDWVIVGGESGPGARPCNIEWIRSIVRQCKAGGVACFVKQLGQNATVRNDSEDECWPGSTIPIRDEYEPTFQGEDAPLQFMHRKGGDPEEWPEDLRCVREFPAVEVAG